MMQPQEGIVERGGESISKTETGKQAAVREIQRVFGYDSIGDAEEKIIAVAVQAYVVGRLWDEGYIKSDDEYISGGYNDIFRTMWKPIDQPNSEDEKKVSDEAQKLRAEVLGVMKNESIQNGLEYVYRAFVSKIRMSVPKAA